MKEGNCFCQIMRFKQIMFHWKHKKHSNSIHSYSPINFDECKKSSNSCDSKLRAPSGSLGVYIGTERKRFVIPTRFLKFPVFIGLLKKSEEEFGLQNNGGLVLPCEVCFFVEIIKLLKKNETKYGKFSLEEFVKMFGELNNNNNNSQYYCKENNVVAVTPLLQKARSF